MWPYDKATAGAVTIVPFDADSHPGVEFLISAPTRVILSHMGVPTWFNGTGDRWGPAKHGWSALLFGRLHSHVLGAPATSALEREPAASTYPGGWMGWREPASEHAANALPGAAHARAAGGAAPLSPPHITTRTSPPPPPAAANPPSHAPSRSGCYMVLRGALGTSIYSGLDCAAGPETNLIGNLGERHAFCPLPAS